MKKLATIIAAALLAFAITGCSSGASSSNASDASASSSEASDVAASDSGDAASASSEEASVVEEGELAWKDSEDIKAAGEAAGFSDSFEVPNPLPIGDYSWSEPTFIVMDKVVQAHFDGGGVSASIRKAEGVDSEVLPKDLNEYAADWTQDCDGIKVTCRGFEKDIANALEWEVGDCLYNVWCVSTGEGNIGMTEDEVAAMVAGIK